MLISSHHICIRSMFGKVEKQYLQMSWSGHCLRKAIWSCQLCCSFQAVACEKCNWRTIFFRTFSSIHCFLTRTKCKVCIKGVELASSLKELYELFRRSSILSHESRHSVYNMVGSKACASLMHWSAELTKKFTIHRASEISPNCYNSFIAFAFTS